MKLEQLYKDLYEALNVGDKLWADEDFFGVPDIDIDLIKFFNKLYAPDFEPNTMWEDALLKRMQNYFYANTDAKELGMLLNKLLPLKSKFPRLLDPAQSKDVGGSGKPWQTGYEGYAWRGATMPLSDLQRLIPQSRLVGQANEKDPKRLRIDGFAIDDPNFVYKSRGNYGFTSFSLDAYTADNFKGQFEDDRVSVVYGVKLTDPNLIMNPDVSNLLSKYKEYETLYVGDKVKPDVIMVTDRRIKDQFKDDARISKFTDKTDNPNPLAYFDEWKRTAKLKPPSKYVGLKEDTKMKSLYQVYTEIQLSEVGEGTSKPFEFNKYPNNGGKGFAYKINGEVVNDDGKVLQKVPINLNGRYNGMIMSKDFTDKEILDFFGKNDGTSIKGFEIIFSIVTEDGADFSMVDDRVFMYRLMATIKKILQDEFAERDPDYIVYSPTKQGKEKAIDTGRHKLYNAFIKKALPNAQMFYNKKDDEIIYKLK